MTQLKNDRTYEKTFSQRRHIDNQQAHGKMRDISNHQRNANQNQNELSSPPSQNNYHQKPKITNVGEDMTKKEHLYAIDGNVNRYNPYSKPYSFLKRTKKINYHVINQFHFCVCIWFKKKKKN